MPRLQYLAVPILVLAGSLTGCLAAASLAVGTGISSGIMAAANATNPQPGTLSFDSVQMTKGRASTRSMDTITVRGVMRWNPPGKNAEFLTLTPQSTFEVQFFDSTKSAVISNMETAKIWDGKEVITALPPNTPLRFELKAAVPASVWRVIVSAKMKGMHFMPLKTVK